VTAVAEDRHRHQERGEVRAAAQRKAFGPRQTRPRLPKTPFLEGGDRAMLRAVQVQRSAAQQPAEQRERRGEPCREPEPVGCESKHERSGDRRDEKDPLTSARDALTPEKRRQGSAQS